MKRNKQYRVWQDAIYEDEADWEYDYEQWKEDGGDASTTIDEFIQTEVDYYFEDEYCNLNQEVSNGIICIADMGLWNGRRLGFKENDLDNIRECLRNAGEGYKRFYVENGDFKAEVSHHDGTNRILFREWRDGISDNQKERLRDALYMNRADEADTLIKRYTKGLGRRIAEIYGW